MKRLTIAIGLALVLGAVVAGALQAQGYGLRLYGELPTSCDVTSTSYIPTVHCAGAYCTVSRTIYLCVDFPMTVTAEFFSYGRPGGSAWAYFGPQQAIVAGSEPNRVAGDGSCIGTYLNISSTLALMPGMIYQLSVGGTGGPVGCSYGPDAFGELVSVREAVPTGPEAAEVIAMTPPPEADIQGQQGTGIPLPDLYAGVDVWLGVAEQTVASVNRGNILYMIAGILVAGVILEWVINKVKNPD